jgi:transcriptional regulator with XRE-family HTH domain
MTALALKETAIARQVRDLRALGGLKNVDIANILGVSPPTVHRWSKGQASPTIEKQQVIADLRWVAERLSDFYEPDEARLWLQTGHPQLAGEKPYDLINEDRTAAVLEVIDRLESGVYL